MVLRMSAAVALTVLSVAAAQAETPAAPAPARGPSPHPAVALHRLVEARTVDPVVAPQVKLAVGRLPTSPVQIAANISR